MQLGTLFPQSVCCLWSGSCPTSRGPRLVCGRRIHITPNNLSESKRVIHGRIYQYKLLICNQIHDVVYFDRPNGQPSRVCKGTSSGASTSVRFTLGLESDWTLYHGIERKLTTMYYHMRDVCHILSRDSWWIMVVGCVAPSQLKT
jgi:hypothetical protein